MEIIKDRNGKEIAVLHNDLISGWIRENGRLDHDQNALPQIIKYIKEGDVVIDAGAYCGDHTIAYANKVGANGRVYALEPNPVAFEALLFNMKDLPQVVCHPYALSYPLDKNNYVIDYNEGNVGASYIRQKDKGSNITMYIDAAGLEKLDFIKLDCEGFEYNILLGGEQTIKKLKPIMVLEINKGALARNGHNEGIIFDLLNQWNYTYRNIYEGQKMEGEQYDIIAFPKSL